jgi:hypothetical protein
MKIYASLAVIALLLYVANAQNMTACPTCCKLLPSRPKQEYTYHQSTGVFIGGQGEWKINTTGYSGNGKGRNNPEMQVNI